MIRKTALFAVLALGLAWLVAVPLWLDPGNAALAGLLVSLMMFTPAIAVAIVALVTRQKGFWRFVGAWPMVPIGRFVGMCVLGLLGPIALVIAGVAAVSALGLVELDIEHLSGFAAQLAAAAPGKDMPDPHVLAAVQFIAIPVAAIIPNGFLAFGEELAWRGWLTSALRPYGVWPTLLITGVLWGLWHAPVILLGHNYGRTDVWGVLLMVGACIAWGAFFGWLRLRSRSLWPAVFAHGSLNASAGLIMVVLAATSPYRPEIAGPMGIVMWILLAALVGILALCGQFRPAKLVAQSTP
ncbi:abortive infection protein [Microbacterium sorbitolivorans]|uniref:CPBP family intramembrane glutamic endopeptidase n=1 Tax=Microbacterium sorbitolivorans TaxID=1867410 RepID=UPI0019A0F877|nr:CPBP family intramembrane glutamic endopeptidase [Microbacterium sorbitolivorans]GGF43887.1 abortive infection protein [Microbacterium sorbitolivorans]